MTRPTPTRRRRTTLAAVVAAVGMSLTLAACAGPGEPDTEALTVYTAKVTTLDPRQNHGPVGRALADSLLDIDPETFELTPWLAEEWSQNDAGTEFTFVLREGVTFSDGTPLDAEAIKVNFDGAVQQIEDGNGWYIRGLFDHYVETEVVDERTAVVKFSEPNPAFLPTVPTSFLAILSPASFDNTIEERQAGEFVGTGPFVLESYTPNEQITLTRREGYDWASAIASHTGDALVDSITFQFVDEQSVRENALLAGEADLAQNPTIEGAQTLSAQGYQLYSRAQTGNPYSLVANFARPLTRDIAVRRALLLAIDREAIQETITGDAEPASTSVLTPTTFGYSDQSALLGYDLDGANEILDEAGWVVGDDGIRVKDGSRLSLTIVNWWEPKAIEDALTLVKEQAALAGIELNLIQEIGGGTTWEDGEADFLYNNATRPDGGLALYSQYADKFLEPNASATAAEITEPGSDLDAILTQQIVEPDPEVREDLLAQAQEILVRDAVRIPVFDNVNSESGYFAAAPNVTGLRNNSLSELVLYDVALTE